MLGEDKLKILQGLLKNANREEIAWMNGYLTATLAQGGSMAGEAVPAKAAVSKITIVYGTETGNSKRLATAFAGRAKKNGINARVTGMDQYRITDLAKEEYFFPLVSTHGDGEPPAAAKKFFDAIFEVPASLDKLKYSVLALGDTSYPLYCKTGADVDGQLSKLGGHRLLPVQKCDVDYEDDANTWFSHVLEILHNGGTEVAPVAPAVVTKSGGRKTYTSNILSNIILNDRESSKETHHIEITAEDVDYLPGDSIGVIPENPRPVVESIIALTGIDPTQTVTFKNESLPINELLLTRQNIFYLPERVVRKYAEIVQQEIPETRIDLHDLLRIYPVNGVAQFKEVVEILEPITPRLYSIASSPEAHIGEVHITVAKNNFNINNEIKYGLTSDFLSQLTASSPLHFYVHPNAQFRLPEGDKDIIMIGPGTGIAPFRSFIAQRDASGASGRNWLFFGEQHFVSDFLYQTEIQSWLETGVLTKVSLAFSRDQQEKVYVQHRMQQEGKALFEWLESGAYVYVCGSKDPMSVDVENTLLQIIQDFGGRSLEEALQYLDQMKEDGRYLKDVY